MLQGMVNSDEERTLVSLLGGNTVPTYFKYMEKADNTILVQQPNTTTLTESLRLPRVCSLEGTPLLHYTLLLCLPSDNAQHELRR